MLNRCFLWYLLSTQWLFRTKALVMDDLNTPKSSLYWRFKLQEAHRLAGDGWRFIILWSVVLRYGRDRMGYSYQVVSSQMCWLKDNRIGGSEMLNLWKNERLNWSVSNESSFINEVLGRALLYVLSSHPLSCNFCIISHIAFISLGVKKVGSLGWFLVVLFAGSMQKKSCMSMPRVLEIGLRYLCK